MERSMNDIFEDIVGDVPVSVQLNAALSRMAERAHAHEEYVPRSEFEELKRVVEELVALVGDESVATQINNAIKPFAGI